MTQEEFFKRYTYDIDNDRIGGGGFGTVYKAKDNTLHKEVAIKVSQVLVKTTEDGKKKTFSLKDEVEALTHVPEHPNIANYEKDKLFSFKTPQGKFDYAVMQYYPDGNLGNAIKKGLTAEQKEDIATQLLEGIGFLHKHNVVHRDLKPSNILIAKDGGRIIPLITDFGLSKAVDFSDGSMFDNSYNAGTPKYSSPEQLQGKKIRLNTDLWSYGAILYELFTGQQLFTAGSGAANTAQADMEIYNKIVNGNVQSLGMMPEKWRKVAERCLVVDASKRAKDAAELFAIVKGTNDETEVIDGPIVPPVSKPSSDSGKPSNGAGGSEPPKTTHDDKHKNKRGLWIGLGIAAAVIVALLLLLKPKQEPASTDPDTQAYQACQTVADYRAYMRDYGRNALHYTEAKAFVDQYVADSIEQARNAQALADAEQKAKAHAEAEKKEEDAYKKCTTIAACDSYLKTYPQGRYVAEVRRKKTELEKAQQPQQGLTGTAGGHEWVDLGLPSGTLWATCNIGASRHEDYGDYFAWGEKTPKTIYLADTYQHANGALDKLTKYCNYSGFGNNGFTDNLTVLQGRDDPATSWGSGWHVPDKTQWDELLKHTSNKWVTQNGVKGRLFTSKNGQSLFLPAAGMRWNNEQTNENYKGYYWSRLLYNGNPLRAWNLYMDSGNCLMTNDFSARIYGFSVRPVRQK